MNRVDGFQTTPGLRAAAALGFLILVFLPNAAFAACSPGAASPEKISDFTSNPSSLLAGPDGPRSSTDISSDVRDLIASDPAALPLIIGLLKTAPLPSSDLQRAIGTGLGLAANLCIRPDPTFAAEIQTQLAGTNAPDAKQQYAAITGNQLIGSVGGGAGGVSGGASGGQVTAFYNASNSAGSLQTFVANSVSNTPTSFFGGTTSSAGSTSNTRTTTTITTTTTSVSPSTP
jgi:hypothetical protein